MRLKDIIATSEILDIPVSNSAVGSSVTTHGTSWLFSRPVQSNEIVVETISVMLWSTDFGFLAFMVYLEKPESDEELCMATVKMKSPPIPIDTQGAIFNEILVSNVTYCGNFAYSLSKSGMFAHGLIWNAMSLQELWGVGGMTPASVLTHDRRIVKQTTDPFCLCLDHRSGALLHWHFGDGVPVEVQYY